MTFRQYLFVMMIGTVISWATFWLIVNLVDPLSSGFVGLIFFYLSLGIAASGPLALVGLVVRTVVVRTEEVLSKQVVYAFREAILISLMLILALILQSRNMLNVVTSLILVAVVVLMEFFFLSYKPKIG